MTAIKVIRIITAAELEEPEEKKKEEEKHEVVTIDA